MNEYPTDSNIIEYMLTLLNISDHADGDPDFLSTIGNLKAASSVQPLPAMLEEHSDHVPNGIIRFMNQMPGGFFIYHADDKEQIIYVNQALLRIFQCETAEEFRRLTGNSFKGMVHPEDLAPVEESIRKQIAQSKYDLDYVEYRIIRRDGEIRWIEDYGHFVRSEIVGDVFYVFLVDATEKKEQRLRERARSEREWQNRIASYDAERALINQEHLRRLEVIEGLSVNYESIFYVDMEEEKIRPYRLSGRTEAIFTERDMLAYTACMEDYIRMWVHEEDRDRVAMETSPASVRRKLTGDLTFYLNYRVVENGTVEYLQVRFVNVGRKDRASQIVLGCRRVDEELRWEMEQKQLLEEALHNANSSIVAKNTFLSNMSHDMRTPLNAIFGFTALARHNLNSPEVMADYLNRIESSSRQLLDMIDKVLKLSWIDSNEARAEETPFSLWEALNEVWAFLLPQAEEKGLDFTLDCSQVTHDLVLGDREKLGQLVMYLVNNAVTYTPAGGSNLPEPGIIFTVGNPMVRPSCFPLTTLPATMYGMPRSRSASSMFPASTWERTYVELTSRSSRHTLSIISTPNPSFSPICRRSSAFPAPWAPKDKSFPAARKLTFIRLTSTSDTKVSGAMAAVSRFKGNSTKISTPMRSNKNRFSSFVVSSLPSDPPKNTAGAGSKVKTQAARPSFFRDNISSRSRLWPICIPSNLPMAAAVSLFR